MENSEVLKKAQELLETQNTDFNHEEQMMREGSFDEEEKYKEDKSLEETTSLEENKKESDKIQFTIPRLGYQRLIHYKKPSLFKIFIGLIGIATLLWIAMLLMPYVKPAIG